MEQSITRNINNGEYLPLMGKYLSIPQLERNHTIHYYLVNPEVNTSSNLNCTACRSQKPVLIRDERDHMGQRFIEAFCNSCAPKPIMDVAKSQNE